MQMGDLERVVTDTAAAIDRHVMSTMLEKHSLAAHCTAIKRYLLLGQVTLLAATLARLSHVFSGSPCDMPGDVCTGKSRVCACTILWQSASFSTGAALPDCCPCLADCMGSTPPQQGSYVQGDFVAALIDGINQDLGKDVRDISVYSLNSALDTAVRASSAQCDDPDIIARLQIRLEESVGTETGRPHKPGTMS